MTAAFTNYQKREYEGFGRDLGVALAMIFIEANEGSHQWKELFEKISKGDYDRSKIDPLVKNSTMRMISEVESYIPEDSRKSEVNYLDTVMTEESRNSMVS
jgi:hypothetical protein